MLKVEAMSPTGYLGPAVNIALYRVSKRSEFGRYRTGGGRDLAAHLSSIGRVPVGCLPGPGRYRGWFYNEKLQLRSAPRNQCSVSQLTLQ